MTFDVDDFLDQREGWEASCRIVTKGGLLEEVKRLESDLKVAKKADESENRVPEAPKIQDRIDELRSQLESTSREFRFREIPRHVYETLITENPPRKEDVEAGAQWHAEKFPPLLIAAAASDPELSREDAKKLWRNLPFGEARRLFVTALQPQGKVGAVPLAERGTGPTPITETTSGTAAPEDSPEASS